MKLLVDDREVVPQLHARRRPNGLYEDHYHHANLGGLAPGKHLATAIARVLATDREIRRSTAFLV